MFDIFLIILIHKLNVKKILGAIFGGIYRSMHWEKKCGFVQNGKT